ncbi:MAG: hypothetical protein ABI760_06045 [Ferruginibacter sp.]
MKLIPVIVLLTFLSCNNAEKKETMSMPGAYNMLSQSWNDGKTDTTYTTLKQLKIYTDDFMMYGKVNPADSVSSFGIGSYSADTGVVVEKAIYSASDTSASDVVANYTLLIEKTPKGYKQVIPEIVSQGQKIKLTEDYEADGTVTKSPLDGAWKEIKYYTIKGKDTVINKAVQYKTYYAGHFIFGHTYLDSTGKLHTGMGYGTFEMNGTNKVKENVSASTYYQIRGKSFDIDIEMNGTDEFKQIITNTDGTKDVEVYQRLKK